MPPARGFVHLPPDLALMSLLGFLFGFLGFERFETTFVAPRLLVDEILSSTQRDVAVIVFLVSRTGRRIVGLVVPASCAN